MNYDDLFIIDKDRIVTIIEHSRYCNQIHYIFIIVINKKIMYEKQYIIDHPIYNKPNDRSEIRNRRWSIDSYNSLIDSPNRLSTIIENYGVKHKISPEENHPADVLVRRKNAPALHTSEVTFGDQGLSAPLPNATTSQKSSSKISFLSSQRLSQKISFISNDEEYEYMEEYLNGLSVEHTRMIVKYYNIYFKNPFITHLLNEKYNTNCQQILMLKWLYGYIDSYIHSESIHYITKCKKQMILERYMNRQLKSNGYLLSKKTLDDVQTNITNKHTPSDEITLSQRMYRILSKTWKCFSIFILYFWLFAIRICMG